MCNIRGPEKPSRATRTSSGKGLQRSRSPCGYKRFGVRPQRLKNKPARQSEDRSDRAWAPPTQRGATSSGHHHGFPFDEFGRTPPPRPPTWVPSITGSADKPKNVHIPSWSAGLAAASWSWQWRWVANGVRRQQISYVSWHKLATAQSSQPYERQLSKPP